MDMLQTVGHIIHLHVKIRRRITSAVAIHHTM